MRVCATSNDVFVTDIVRVNLPQEELRPQEKQMRMAQAASGAPRA
jgi:hypothetical protein